MHGKRYEENKHTELAALADAVMAYAEERVRISPPLDQPMSQGELDRLVGQTITADAYAEAHFDERMTGFNFSEAVDCVGEDGEPLRDLRDDSVDKVVRAPAKDWATKCITARLQQCGYAMAYDNEALNWMTNHTSKEGAKHTIYAKDNDHNIDARRQQMLRMLFDDQGADLDHFSTGVHDRRAA